MSKKKVDKSQSVYALYSRRAPRFLVPAPKWRVELECHLCSVKLVRVWVKAGSACPNSSEPLRLDMRTYVGGYRHLGTAVVHDPICGLDPPSLDWEPVMGPNQLKHYDESEQAEG